MAISAKHPKAWGLAETFRQGRGKPGAPTWPDWCYLPMGGWYAIVASTGGAKRLDLSRIGDVSKLAALGAWRMTQGIYRFDPALLPALLDTPLANDLPCDLLQQMPEWCVYLETPGLRWSNRALKGVWAHLEQDANTGETELRLLTDPGLSPIVVHIGPWPLHEAILRSEAAAMANTFPAGLGEIARHLPETRPVIRAVVEPVLSMLLYLCSQTADISKRGEPGWPANPQAKKTERGWKSPPASGPMEWDVGVRMGAALRAAYQREQMGGDATSDRGQIRPHVRRAHWRTIVSGPRKDGDGADIPSDKRKRELRWTPPIAVNIDDYDKLPTTIRPVPGSNIWDACPSSNA